MRRRFCFIEVHPTATVARMMIRTYFWHDRTVPRPVFRVLRKLRLKPYQFFVTGNAGDLLAGELIAEHYGAQTENDKKRGSRLLMVGSIAHCMKDGDVLCGIGTKDRPMPSASEARVTVWALRGPITYDRVKAAGHDVSNVQFLYDPGLLMRFRAAQEAKTAKPHGVIFIPHYRERGLFVDRPPKGMRLVDIDATPMDVARAILNAELVYTSSLHGVIFAHALNRPVVLVRPQTPEPQLKYEDYFASVNVPFPKPLDSIWDADLKAAPTSPAEVNYSRDEFVFPDVDFLRERGVARR